MKSWHVADNNIDNRHGLNVNQETKQPNLKINNWLSIGMVLAFCSDDNAFQDRFSKFCLIFVVNKILVPLEKFVTFTIVNLVRWIGI